MRLIIAFIMFTCFQGVLSAQDNFIIKGRINQLSKGKNIIVLSSFGMFTAAVNGDGSFEIRGKLEGVGAALIKTDSSGADAIWLEPGTYTLECMEINVAGTSGYQFRTPVLKGPKDAEIYHGFVQPLYYAKGTNPEEKKQFYKKHYITYIDSIFKFIPESKVLPDMIRHSQGTIGDDATQAYYSFLSADLKNESDAKQIEYYFKRKEKIAKEEVFENFSMETDKGAKFVLSSLKGKKLVLIDFWSSDCYPCRKKHEKLIDLYAKYAGMGLEIVSVSLDNNKDEWLKAIKKDNMTWINVSELRGWETSLALTYFVKTLPFALWLDGNMKIIATDLSEKEIENRLNPASPVIN